jgi:hypothetical protein
MTIEELEREEAYLNEAIDRSMREAMAVADSSERDKELKKDKEHTSREAAKQRMLAAQQLAHDALVDGSSQ